MRRIIICLPMAAAAIALAALPAGAADELQRSTPPATESPSAEKPDKADPPQAEEKRVSAAGLEYVVQEGDTLAEIAEKKLGTPEKWKVIARANGIDDPRELRVGQKLTIPGDQVSEPSRTRL